jgi:predicted aspartyl protease
MRNAGRYPFISADVTLGEAGFRPYLPISLVYQQQSVATSGLLDTGATVNVLPYPIGVELGYEWERQTTTLNLTGNLAQYEARVVVVQAVIGQFEPVQLVFAWTQATNVPLILGQVNFFME